MLNIESLGVFMIYLAIAWIPIWIPIWWFLGISTPKTVISTYFKEPHFTKGELVFMNLFPGLLFRTAIFGWALCIPSLGKKRELINLSQTVPKWYAVTLKIFVAGSMIHGISFIVLLIGLLIYTFIFDA